MVVRLASWGRCETQDDKIVTSHDYSTWARATAQRRLDVGLMPVDCPRGSSGSGTSTSRSRSTRLVSERRLVG